VLFCGESLRHLRLGYLLQRRFPGLLKAWWTAAPPRATQARSAMSPGSLLANTTSGSAALRKLQRGEIGEVAAMVRRRVRTLNLRTATRALRRAAAPLASRDRSAEIERDMFARDVELLRETAAVRAVDPYLVLAWDPPPLDPEVITAARGVAVRQQTGWLPAIEGPSAIEAALYHRQPAWVGGTVHLMNAASAAGPILRRSSATLHPDDSVAHCIVAACAVGTALMLQVVDDVLERSELIAFPQPQGARLVGDTRLPPATRDALAGDFAAGWLGDAIAAAKDY
jgi:hypothetical protein